MQRTRQTHAWLLIACALLLLMPLSASAQITANVAVSKQQVVVGEPFRYRIQINNAQQVTPPDLADQVSNLVVEFLNIGQNESSQITIINGQRSQTNSREHLIDFQLTALQEGTVVIPAVEVQADGRTLRTQAVPIQVTAPPPNDSFFLTTKLSKNTGYVGEALTLTTTFYFDQQIRDVNYVMPLLALDTLDTVPLPQDQAEFSIPINGETVHAQQGQASRDGETFVTLTFQHALIPRKAGTLELPRSFVSAQAPSGRAVRRRPLFGIQQEYTTVVAAAPAQNLTVVPLPEEGKPADFSGLVGTFALSATASPTQVNVGDPITLIVAISGPDYLDKVDLPPLDSQTALAQHFRIPEEMAPGVVEGKTKRFTQTIRAQSADVTEVPPLTLSYFDVNAGRYETIQSKPIPLTVHETTIVTAAEAEGHSPTVEVAEHREVNKGIAHNFTDTGALTPQRFGPDVWLQTAGSWLFLFLPPTLYGVLAITCYIRKRGGLFAIDRSQARAFPEAQAALEALDHREEVHGPVLDILRTYLGTRLQRQARALTVGDVDTALQERKVSDETRDNVKALFAECEAHRYAGGAGAPTENAEFVQRTHACLSALNEELGR